jgi:hypothetical protein
MRELTPDMRAAGRGLRGKVKDGVITQASSLFGFLGLNILACPSGHSPAIPDIPFQRRHPLEIPIPVEFCGGCLR